MKAKPLSQEQSARSCCLRWEGLDKALSGVNGDKEIKQSPERSSETKTSYLFLHHAVADLLLTLSP